MLYNDAHFHSFVTSAAAAASEEIKIFFASLMLKNKNKKKVDKRPKHFSCWHGCVKKKKRERIKSTKRYKK